MSKPVAFIFAHPDDETFLCASFVRRLADEGNRPILLLATKGDAGGKNGAYSQASREQLGAIREEEMKKAGEHLGVDSISYLGYPDGQLNTVDAGECVERIAEYLNSRQTEVVVTFPADGLNRHPDHMAISKFVTQAVTSGKCPSVRKLYYVMPPVAAMRTGHQADLWLDTKPIWDVKRAAIQEHASQILAVQRFFGDLAELPELRRFESLRLAWERDEGQPRSAGAWLTE